jgi:hypothetical protein
MDRGDHVITIKIWINVDRCIQATGMKSSKLVPKITQEPSSAGNNEILCTRIHIIIPCNTVYLIRQAGSAVSKKGRSPCQSYARR